MGVEIKSGFHNANLTTDGGCEAYIERVVENEDEQYVTLSIKKDEWWTVDDLEELTSLLNEVIELLCEEKDREGLAR